MNKSIYTLVNAVELYPEAQYSSYDKSLLEEIMCDEFMLDVMYEFNSRINGAEIVSNEFLNNNKERIAEESWNEVLDYYNDYVSIIMSDVI
jgi:hypothetical protein